MNVVSIVECVKPLNAWIHEGDDTVRGQREKCLRTLGEKSVTPEEATKCLSLVMGAFVKYSEGTGKGLFSRTKDLLVHQPPHF